MQFINDYLVQIIQIAVSVIFATLGIAIRRLTQKYINTDTKHTLAKDIVQCVEQIYNDLHGEDKLNAAIAMFTDQLKNEGINITEYEMRILLESAVNEFNRKRLD